MNPFKLIQWTELLDHFKNQISFTSIFGESEKSFRVGYGSNDLVELHDRELYAEVGEVHPHGKYEMEEKSDGSVQVKNDIGLIKLKTPLIFSEAVRPACLPDHYQKDYYGVLEVRLSFALSYSTLF